MGPTADHADIGHSRRKHLPCHPGTAEAPPFFPNHKSAALQIGVPLNYFWGLPTLI